MATGASPVLPDFWKSHMYTDKLPDHAGEIRELLENYSHVPPEEVENHLYKIRDKAWSVRKYPCIGRWAFTRLDIFLRDPRYKVAVARLTDTASEDTLLDLGCCLGQNLRQLVYAGVSPARLFASDLHADFLDLGFELFQDRERLEAGGATFVAGDMLDSTDPNLAKLAGKVTLVHAANFFHLFGWDAQVKIGERIVRFLKPGTRDALIFGRQIGSLEPKPEKTSYGGDRFLHDQASFQRLWDEVGERTGTKWRVEVEVIAQLPVEMVGFGEAARMIRYGVYMYQGLK